MADDTLYTGWVSGFSGFSGIEELPPRITPPTMREFQYTPPATTWPTYMRALGERMAQEEFQKQVASGVRAGSAAQMYQKALQNLHAQRLNYMTQAGQQLLNIQKLLSEEEARRNQEMLDIYRTQVQERGQDIGAMASMYGASMRSGGGGGGGTISLGGRLPGYAPGTYTGLGGVSYMTPGFYQTQGGWAYGIPGGSGGGSQGGSYKGLGGYQFSTQVR
ncbi:MAG: hypothetical protein QXH80_00055 [Candidatus Nanoarchaeia archaeon]